VRAALISLTEGQLRLAGKTLARRQLDFALAAGCESVIVLGDGGSAEAIALRHAAEGAGARFQAIRDSQGLLGAVRADDELLALAPGLLPEAPAALEALKGRAVLVLPAGPGVAAGFERIDLERAWAGALVVGGAQVERLSDLPADIEPASALVRIALQARVPEKRLPEGLLADGSWSVPSDAAVTEPAWLKRHASTSRSFAPTEWLGQQALRPLASRLLAAPRAVEGLALAAVAVLAGAILAAWYGWSTVGFGLVPVGALLVDAVAGLAQLRDAPFGRTKRRSLTGLLPWLIDATILACAVLSIEGSWLHRLFPPLVLLGTLHALRPATRSNWAILPGDRGLLAVLLAIAAAFGVVEPAIMLLALGLIGLNVAQSRRERG
jgi:hypothetical protein